MGDRSSLGFYAADEILETWIGETAILSRPGPSQFGRRPCLLGP